KPVDTPPPQQVRQTDFNTLPRVPGTVVRMQPQPNTNTAQKTNPPQGSPTIPAGKTDPEPLPPNMQSADQEPPLLAAVRAYVEGHPERAIEIIRTLEKQNQDFVLAVLPILATGARADLTNDAATIGMLVDQLEGVRARLEQRAPLRVENVSFC